MPTEKTRKKDVIATSIRPTDLLTAVLVNDGLETKELFVSKEKFEGKHHVFDRNGNIVGFASFESLKGSE